MLLYLGIIMHRRPRLQEAVNILKQLALISEDAATALDDYRRLLNEGNEFAAAHLVVEIIDYYYHLTGVKETVNA